MTARACLGPERENPTHHNLPEPVLPVGADVPQEEVTKRDLVDSHALVLQQYVFQLRLVDLVGGALWNPDLLKGKPQRDGLRVKKASSHAVHAYPVEPRRDRRKQSLDAVGARPNDLMEGERAVLSAAP